MAARHGTRTRYQQGCKDGPGGGPCDPCREAEQNYQKRRRQGLTTVTTLKPKKTDTEEPQPTGPGPVEQGVIAELADLPAAKKRPGLAQTALVLARDLDRPTGIAQHSALAGRLQEILDVLRKSADKGGKLAAVTQMTLPNTATG